MHGTSYSRVILKGDVSCKGIYFFKDLLFFILKNKFYEQKAGLN
jgi:hypothetical protein